jgi:hypothetical protein
MNKKVCNQGVKNAAKSFLEIDKDIKREHKKSVFIKSISGNFKNYLENGRSDQKRCNIAKREPYAVPDFWTIC